ncbi:uncharacterized protein DUF1800 [Mucilaginibacter yixingensis]|uniref:Uncharacterized protein DUF1800 n=1 Tax=Mucilaginibacter yixingensis TaxID=1295612 RepID=A0A2T5JAU7_9SPHI|nr:DUF1800 family protein [Mucilaginibacter yixingensis]PTQ97988.1 uncharacterized protein DUF1800 [Mucilaginibacter yixingensis]
MKTLFRCFFLLMLTVFGVSVLSSFLIIEKAGKPKLLLPYKQAGLTERQAAAHLLSRFTFGARPGDVDKVVKMGLENWLEQQLDGNLPDDSVDAMLDKFDALKMSNAQIANTFPKGGQVQRMAIRDGVIERDSVNNVRKEYRDKLQAYMQQKGLRPEQELLRQFYNQKILRAAYSNNQLHEVLTDFWFNHFNVSVTKNDCSQFIPNYERDVIRPNVTAKFGDLLLATAKSPAMLYYLDNFTSTGVNTNQQHWLVLRSKTHRTIRR